MPRNTQGGKKYKQQKHKGNTEINKPIIEREDGQEYAYVTQLLGNSKVTAQFFDRTQKRVRDIICILRPGLKKKRLFAKMGSLMLISLRDFELSKADVIHIYNEEEARRMQRKNLINDSIIKKEDENDEFNFGEENYDSDEENLKKEKTIIKEKNNISVQDFGIPSSDDEEEEIENI